MELVQLPGELVEEIFFRVPPQSLVRFRIVCGKWNTLFQEKRFARSQLDHVNPQFIGIQSNKIFSIDVNLDDLTVKVCHIYVDIPGVISRLAMDLTYCDGLLICEIVFNGTVVWNPLLRQGRRIITDDITDDHRFVVCGIGYNSSRSQMGYKLFGYYYHSIRVGSDRKLAIYECASDTWKFINAPYQKWPIEEPLDEYMSLNGNSYWTAYNTEASEYFIRKFDFTKEILKHFCFLPCKKNYKGDTHYLSIFRGERFSMLEQCYRTREIEIWVTMNKIKNGDEEDVLWIKFMKVTIPDIPQFFHQFTGCCPTYFVDNKCEKSLVICCHDESDQCCIYIVRGDLSRKIEIDSMVAGFRHSIYVPSLIPPLLERSLSHDIESTYLE